LDTSVRVKNQFFLRGSVGKSHFKCNERSLFSTQILFWSSL
jgi:hypothetical protein